MSHLLIVNDQYRHFCVFFFLRLYLLLCGRETVQVGRDVYCLTCLGDDTLCLLFVEDRQYRLEEVFSL